MVFLIYSQFFRPNFEEDLITLLALKLKLKSLDQTCISLITQLTQTISPDSAILIEKKGQQIDCGKKVNFCGEKKTSLEE